MVHTDRCGTAVMPVQPARIAHGLQRGMDRVERSTDIGRGTGAHDGEQMLQRRAGIGPRIAEHAANILQMPAQIRQSDSDPPRIR
ncbi:hypothetical protein AB0E01_28795 [Nocardia vinacea]|uniref:hypothetical protein n=1 Tax=Nocardia vinacea TaxID=96468 RepID=UPI0033F14E93